MVLRALAKERELRQQSAGEMKTEVETISSTPRPSPVPPPVPGVASPRQSPNRSSATGGSSEPPVNAKQTAEPIFPRWLLMDVGRVLLALFVVSFLSVAIPLVLMIVTSPIWVLDLILFQSTTAWVEHIYQPWQYARDIGKFIAVILCVVVDAALLTLIWRRWLRHVSPRRVGASLRWLFTPYPVEQRRSSEQPNPTTSAPRATEDRFEPPASSEFTGGQSRAPISIVATETARGSVSGNRSGSGGWWALAALFIGTPLAMTPMVGFTVRVVTATPPPSPAWVVLAVALSLLFLVGGTLGPIWLGWRHLICQRRDHSRNGIIPAMIAAWFLPLLILDVVLFYCIVGPLDRHRTAQLIALYVAPFMCVIVDGVILTGTWCWVTHSPFKVPAGLKSARLWYPLGWTVLSAFVAWGASEAVQSYGRYKFTRWDSSVEMLEAKSGGYFVRGGVVSYTSAQGNRSEPTPDRALWGMAFIRQSNTERGDSSVEVALPDLTIRRSHTVPNDIPLNEENLLAQMMLAGIDTNRLEVAAEARSLIETAGKLSTALLKHSQLSLFHLIDPRHWKVTTRSHFEGVVRHGWDVTHHTARGSLNIQVDEDDALRAMAAVVAFWLVGLALLLGLLPTRETRSGHETGMSSSESPWPSRAFRVVASLAGLGSVVTVVTFLPAVVKLVTQTPPAIPSPPPIESPNTTTDVAHVAVRDEDRFTVPAKTSPEVLSAAEAEAKRLGLIRVAEASSGANVSQQPIGLKGAGNELFVEPHFSALVQLPKPTNLLAFTIQGTRGTRGTTTLPVSYPCDYIACDWTAGTDKPRIMGYMLPPGAYDFRADVETTKLLNEMDSAKRAKIAEDTLTIIRAAALKAAATESDWQQGTQAAHVRFKLVPQAISKLRVPDECLVVLTEKSRSLFTRSGGNFTKHEFVTDNYIRELRESMKPAVIANDVEIVDDSPADATSPENIPR